MEPPALTPELLEATFKAILKQGVTPRHDCRFDGHVASFMATRCVYCGETIRTLSVDENHLRLGEFDT